MPPSIRSAAPRAIVSALFKDQNSRPPEDPIRQHRTLFEAIANADPDGARVAAVKLVEQALADTEALWRED